MRGRDAVERGATRGAASSHAGGRSVSGRRSGGGGVGGGSDGRCAGGGSDGCGVDGGSDGRVGGGESDPAASMARIPSTFTLLPLLEDTLLPQLALASEHETNQRIVIALG